MSILKRISKVKTIQIFGLSVILFALTMPLKANAETNVVSLVEGKDYLQQKEIISKKTNENNQILEKLDNDLKESEEKLVEHYEASMDYNTSYNNKKSAIDKGYSSNMDTLKMFDIILGSSSVGDFFKNLDLAKNVTISKNNEAKNNELKMDVLVKEQELLIEDYKAIDGKKAEILDENKTLDKLSKDIEASISRKGNVQFNPNDILSVSNASLEDIQNALRGTALYDLAPTYLEIENKFQINAFFIMALSAHESSWGTSKRAVEDNNLTGFGVFYDDSKGINSSSKRDNLMLTASWVKKHYLTSGGSYFKGTSTIAINQSYAKNADGSVNTEWANGINGIASRLVEKIK